MEERPVGATRALLLVASKRERLDQPGGRADSHRMGHEPESVAASFLTLAPKTTVVDRFGNVVGRVERVLVTADSYFDGIIVATDVGRRFVDAPEVRSIRESEVVLATVKHDVEHPG